MLTARGFLATRPREGRSRGCLVLALLALYACSPASVPPPPAAGGQKPVDADEWASGSAAPELAPPLRAAAPDALAPGSGPPAVQGSEASLHRELAAGDAALREGRLDAAQMFFEAARHRAPSDPAAGLGLLRVRWARLGMPTAYAEAPQHPELQRLVAMADSLLADHADYAPAWLEKGRLLLVLGDASNARSSLLRSVAIDARDPEAHSALGVAYLAGGEAEKALNEFERATQLAPDVPERLTNLGTAYMLRGRISEAIATYERALSLAPDDARTHGDLGAAELADNRPDLALPHLLRATALAPERATFLTNLGYAYQLQRQLEKAVETQRRALVIDPKLGSAWINLGNALAELGQYAQAEEALTRAEALDPSDPRPKASLRDLAELRAHKSEPPTR
jgi:tetratricopeptide (TPR) repeat protein